MVLPPYPAVMSPEETINSMTAHTEWVNNLSKKGGGTIVPTTGSASDPLIVTAAVLDSRLGKVLQAQNVTMNKGGSRRKKRTNRRPFRKRRTFRRRRHR